MPIDKNTPVPLYFQLAEQFRERIESGLLKPGDQLPSERELGEEFGISRMTARQAIMYLVRHGKLVVKPGIGTFVAEPKLTHDTLHLLGFTEEMFSHGQAATSQVLEQSLVIPPAPVAARLGLKDNEEAIKLVRLRLTDDTPLLLETVYIPQTLAAGLEREDLSKASLYGVLEQRFGLHLERAQQTMEVTTANEDESLLFDIPLGATMLLLEGTTYTGEGQPVEAFKAIYRGDKFKFAMESKRLSWGDGGNLPRLSVVLRDPH